MSRRSLRSPASVALPSVLAFCAFTLLAESAHAAAPESGFEHGLRLGAAVPAGNVETGRSLSDDVALRFPVWVDIGYRLNRVLYTALFAQLGIDRAASACGDRFNENNAECTVEDIRLGVDLLAHLTPDAPLDWWIGAGLGWERLEQRTLIGVVDMGGNAGMQNADEYHQGPALELQAGIDFSVASDLRIGPFASYTVGTYLDEDINCPDMATAPCPKAGDTAFHHWLTAGMRGTFGP